MTDVQDIAARLHTLADELVAAEVDVADAAPGPYQGAYDFKFTRTYNGNLIAADLVMMKDEWVTIVEELQPITHDQWPGGLSFWVTRGGLKIRQRCAAAKAYDKLRREWYDVAAQRALVARKAAGWTGPRFLTTPEGVQTGSNGQYFGPFALPSNDNE